MGLLDTILGVLKTQASTTNAANTTGGADNNILEAVIGMISNPESGGLSGLVEKISAGGLGEQVASWISTGENLPISAEQIQAVLGSSVVQDLATRFGINTNDVAGTLSSLLPQVVDKLTPDGQVPADNSLLQIGLKGLTSLLANKTA
jgi:uncharacterized protein YidB (DUF937 family)